MGKIMTENPKLPPSFANDPLTEVIANGAREILAVAVNAEARQWITEGAHLRDAHGRPLVDQREKLTHKILPQYLRRTSSIDEAIPWIYLHDVSTNHNGYRDQFHLQRIYPLRRGAETTWQVPAMFSRRQQEPDSMCRRVAVSPVSPVSPRGGGFASELHMG